MDTAPNISDLKKLADYSSLVKLAEVLWKQDSGFHGAAIMVGAGFSRSAAATGDLNRKLPLWFDLSNVIQNDLGSTGTDPLRIAEEYSAYFGRQALNDVIKKEVNDAAWKPGKMHSSLLELPWTDVLTTNWDTLLEKASEEVHERLYSIVYRQADLSSARSPRIVKLHGTINVTENLTFTQEDYRLYPEKRAAFVNLSRQIFIENELCLLGFSGDDPNFLQWAGWVRDHLATSARRIYLVGSLGLTSAKRKYLESMNIAPIDLEVLVSHHDDSDLKHKKATEIFLHVLNLFKPKPLCDWEPTSFDRSLSFEGKLKHLKADRNLYPGWLICPSHKRFSLHMQLADPSLISSVTLSQLDPDSHAELLYEITWRHGLTYEVTPEHIISQMLLVCDPSKPNILTKKQQIEIAVHLLKNSRWVKGSESKAVETTTTAIIEKHSAFWIESKEELNFHRATMANYKFDYVELEKIITQIDAKDPVRKLRKATFLGVLGLYEQGKKLIFDAYKELLAQFRNDQNSIYIISRLAVAEYLATAIDYDIKKNKLMDSSKELNCDVYELIAGIRDQVRRLIEQQKKSQSLDVMFEPGAFKDNSNTVTFSNEVHPMLVFEGIRNSTGIPIKWDHVGFLVDIASNLTALDELAFDDRFSLAISSANSESSNIIEKTFSRMQMALINKSESDELILLCGNAVHYWSSRLNNVSECKNSIVLTRLRVFIEILARVAVRATEEQAKDLFKLAMKLGSKAEVRHFWLYEALGHLIKYTLASIPKLQHQELLLDSMSFPLATEISMKHNFDLERWPNPVISFVGERKSNTSLDRRLGEVIDNIAPCSPNSRYSLERLLPLLDSNFLSEEEENKIAQKIWGRNIELNKLPETGLLYWVLLKLPRKEQKNLTNLVREKLFKIGDSSIIEPNRLYDIISAAQVEKVKQLPNKDEAKLLFEHLVEWRPSLSKKSNFNRDQDDTETGKLIGQALANSVVPSLSKSELTKNNFTKLIDFYRCSNVPPTLIALPYFAIISEDVCKQVEQEIRKGLQASNEYMVSHAAFALLSWRGCGESVSATKLTSILVSVISHNRTAGMANLLWAAKEMFIKGYLSESEVDTLIESLPLIFDSTNYKIPSNFSPETTTTITLIRSECIKVAQKIIELNKSESSVSDLSRIIDEGMSDTLPEVRFALEAKF